MRGLPTAVGVLVLAAAGAAWGQQAVPPGAPPQAIPGTTVTTPITRGDGPAAAGAYGPLLGLLAQRPRPGGQTGEPGYPMFQIAGPDNRAFLADPESAGNALILQGELMMKMGEILVKHGRELLNKAGK